MKACFKRTLQKQKIEFVARRYRPRRVTQQVRLSKEVHRLIKVIAKERKLTMSKYLDRLVRLVLGKDGYVRVRFKCQNCGRNHDQDVNFSVL